jgi:hypothetical protein
MRTRLISRIVRQRMLLVGCFALGGAPKPLASSVTECARRPEDTVEAVGQRQ